MENFKEKLKRITTFIFDVDGVLTDGKVYLFPDNEPIRSLQTKDGFAIQLACKKKYKIAIISGGRSHPVKQALERLGVQNIFLSQSDKLSCYKEFIYENNLKEEEILYMGDDLPDWEVMKRVGLATCPNDAATEIKEICLYISPKKGGEGCVRDIVEQVMRVRGDWEIAHW